VSVTVGAGGVTTKVADAELEPPGPVAVTIIVCEPTLRPVKPADRESQGVSTPSRVQAVPVLSPLTVKATLPEVLAELAGGALVMVTVGAGGVTTKVADAVLEPPGPLAVTTNVCEPTLRLVKLADSESQGVPAPSKVQAVPVLSPLTVKATLPEVLAELAGGALVMVTVGAGGVTSQVTAAKLEPPGPVTVTTKVWEPTLIPVRSAAPEAPAAVVPSRVQVVPLLSPVTMKAMVAAVSAELGGATLVMATVGATGDGWVVPAPVAGPPALKAASPKQ
jgi:hypothetical protein